MGVSPIAVISEKKHAISVIIGENINILPSKSFLLCIKAALG